MSLLTTIPPWVRSLASRQTVGSVFTPWPHRTCQQSSSPQNHRCHQTAFLRLLPGPRHRLPAPDPPPDPPLVPPLDPLRVPEHPVQRSFVSIFQHFYHRDPNVPEPIRMPPQTTVRCVVHHKVPPYPSHSTSGALGSPVPALCTSTLTSRFRFRSSVTATQRLRRRARATCLPSTMTALPYGTLAENRNRDQTQS